MLQARCVTAPNGHSNGLAYPLRDLLLLGALNRPALREHEVDLAAWAPLVRPSLVFRLEQVPSSAVPETGASWLT